MNNVVVECLTVGNLFCVLSNPNDVVTPIRISVLSNSEIISVVDTDVETLTNEDGLCIEIEQEEENTGDVHNVIVDISEYKVVHCFVDGEFIHLIIVKV